jgi:RNA polymerase sigma-70 factor (ECF subfamily)
VATFPNIQHPTIEDFFRAHRSAVYAYLIALARDRSWAEDLLQDTFIKASRSLAGYRGGDPRSWLFTIARSVFIDATRRRRPIPVDEVPEKALDAPDVTDRMVIDSVLWKLPERQRAALLLVDDIGLSYQEAATALDTTLGAFKVLLHRARGAFRTHYSEMTSHD